MNKPLLIGVSARSHYPGHDKLSDRPSSCVWSKTVHYLEQSVAQWVVSGGACAGMVPAVSEGSTLLQDIATQRPQALAHRGIG